MTSYFYMWEKRREDLIAKHNFYVAEGKSRITDQFSDKDRLEKEAIALADEWLAKKGQYFDPDLDDPSDLEEQAYYEQIDFYYALDDLGNSARLALISGMYHLWERSLRDWLTSIDGLASWHKGVTLPKAVWKSNFQQIFELFELAGLFPNGCDIKKSLNACRLVVNTYKHGKGDSFDTLKKERPELFDQHGWRSQSQGMNEMVYVDYTDLYVGPEIIEEFSDAIVGFWKEIAEHITEAEIKTFPKWFYDTYKEDLKGARHAKQL